MVIIFLLIKALYLFMGMWITTPSTVKRMFLFIYYYFDEKFKKVDGVLMV